MQQRCVATPAGDVALTADPGPVWRVGYRPGPWAWTPWQYAGDAGGFSGRFDDPRGSFRTLYAGDGLLACLLEVLAPFRADPLLAEDLAGVVEDPADASEHPSTAPGLVPASWLQPREATTATLSGLYCAVSDKETIPTLRRLFLPAALRYGLADLDGGALRLSAPRALTQAIAAWLYDLHEAGRDLLDGVRFESRHGDGLVLWAIFERDDDGVTSKRLADIVRLPLRADQPELVEAFRLHRLAWAS